MKSKTYWIITPVDRLHAWADIVYGRKSDCEQSCRALKDSGVIGNNWRVQRVFLTTKAEA